MRGAAWPVLIRVIAVIVSLALVGIVLKLIGSILTPVLPTTFMAALSAGWAYLYGLLSPAIPAIGALAILALLIWIILGRR